MSGRRRYVAGVAIATAAVVACALLAHYAVAVAPSPTLGAVLALVPVVVILVGAARRIPRRMPLALLCVALVAVTVWLGWSVFRANFTHVFFLEHSGGNLVLGLTFLRTLGRNRQPLCTRLARHIHGSLPADVERYTRSVTVAWTIFFFLLCAISCALYLHGWIEAWSILANVASPVLIAAMFAAEYAVRVRVLPNHAQVGIMRAVGAYVRDLKAAPEAVR